MRVEPSQQIFAGGEAIVFSGQVYDESMRGVANASVGIDITAPDGTRYPYSLQSTGGGRYFADIGTLPQGPYTYEAEAMREEASLGTDQGSFTVGSMVLEYTESRTDVSLLRQIALQSGGQYLAMHEVSTLERRLRSDSLFVPRSRVETREEPLWQWPVLLILVLMMLASEWVFRKRAGLP